MMDLSNVVGVRSCCFGVGVEGEGLREGVVSSSCREPVDGVVRDGGGDGDVGIDVDVDVDADGDGVIDVDARLEILDDREVSSSPAST